MARATGTGWRGVRWVLAGVAAGLLLQVRGATLVVDPSGGTPYTTIQSAIDAALPGEDDVFVRCGYYRERILLKDGVSVRGEGAPCTTIDGGRRGTVVHVPEVQSTVELSGFTVRGGSMSAASFGFGIHMDGSGAPVITRNIIEDNFNSGIAVYPQASGVNLAPVITRNVIRNNLGCCSGGGIWLAGQSDAVVTSNLIVGNSATYGGGIYAAGKALIAHNTVVQNVAGGYGGGVWADGGIDASPTLRENVIADNRASSGGGVASISTPPLVVSRNDVFHNVPQNYWPGQDPTGQNGNVSVDPLFVDQRANFFGFQLRSSSPLLEAGVGGPSPGEAAFDLAGLPRFLDSDADGAAASDIGARENDGPTHLSALPQGDGFTWDPVVRQPTGYEAFRGDLSVLRAAGVYTQDPAVVPGARHFCALQAPALSDDDVPTPGQVLFYLAAARGAVAGTLGFTSSAVERVRTMECMAP
jgi:hypothetical protein